MKLRPRRATALALALGAATALALTACGGSGGTSASTATTTQGGSATAANHAPPAASKRHASGASARGKAQRRAAGHASHATNAACRNPSHCTAAARAAGTFWPTRRHPQRTSDGSVSYAAPSGEAPPPLPGEMALASPAFAVNEPLPTAYTCDGAGISPPLQWKNVPARAAALVLLVIDLSSNGKSGAVRWIVGDIDPHSRGVAAGRTPAGGVVGANAEGKAAYGPICPAHGKESLVEFQLYALSKPIPLSPGFQPSVAESEYGGLILGHGAATTYALYVRP